MFKSKTKVQNIPKTDKKLKTVKNDHRTKTTWAQACFLYDSKGAELV